MLALSFRYLYKALVLQQKEIFFQVGPNGGTSSVDIYQHVRLDF